MMIRKVRPLATAYWSTYHLIRSKTVIYSLIGLELKVKVLLVSICFSMGMLNGQQIFLSRSPSKQMIAKLSFLVNDSRLMGVDFGADLCRYLRMSQGRRAPSHGLVMKIPQIGEKHRFKLI